MKRFDSVTQELCFRVEMGGTPGGGEIYWAKVYRKGHAEQCLLARLGPNFDEAQDVSPLKAQLLFWWVKLWERRN